LTHLVILIKWRSGWNVGFR